MTRLLQCRNLCAGAILAVCAAAPAFCAEMLRVPLHLPQLEKRDNWQQSLEDLECFGVPRSWTLLGPVKDQGFRIFEREDGAGDNDDWSKEKTISWTRPADENDNYVDFTDLLGGRYDVIGYAQTEVDWPVEGPGLIWFDCLGRAAVYVNNVKVDAGPERKRSSDPGKDAMYPIAVQLKRGRNTIRVKVAQERGASLKGYGFNLRVERNDFDYRRELFEKLNQFYPQESADWRGAESLLELARFCEHDQKFETAAILYARVAEKFKQAPQLLASLRDDYFLQADEGRKRCEAKQHDEGTRIDHVWKVVENHVHSLLMESDTRGADTALRDFIARYPFHEGAGIALTLRGGLRQDYFLAESCRPFFERALREFGQFEWIRKTCLRGLAFARSYRPDKADVPVKHDIQAVIDGVRRELRNGNTDEIKAAMKTIGDLVRDQTDTLLRVSDAQAFPHYAGLREYVRAVLACVSVDARVVYREAVQSAAESQYRAALALGNIVDVESVVWQFYYTPVAARALNRLGNNYADRGAWAQALYTYQLLQRDYPDLLTAQAAPELPTPALLASKIARTMFMNSQEPDARTACETLSREFADSKISIRGQEMSAASYGRLLLGQINQKSLSSPAPSTGISAAPRPGAVAWAQVLPRSPSAEVAREFWREDTFYSHLQSFPVFSGERVFFSTLEGIQCFDGASGKVLWRDNWDSKGSFFPQRFTGFPISCPAVQQGRVYMRALKGQQTSLRSYDVESGKLAWSTESNPALKKMVWLSDPAIACGLAIAVFLEAPQQLDIEPAGSSPANVHGVAAFDAESGDLRWKRNLAIGVTGIRVCERIIGRDNRQWATYRNSMQLGPPVTGNGVIYTQTGLGSLAALNAFTGEVVWLAGYPRLRSDSLESGNSGCDRFLPRVLKMLARGPASPLLTAGTVVLAPKDAPGLIAFDRKSGAIRWINELADYRFLAGICDENILACDDTVSAISAGTGKVIWETNLPAAGKGRGLLGHPGFSGNTLYLPCNDGIHMVDARSGKLIENFMWDKNGGISNLVTNGKYFAGVNSSNVLLLSTKP